MYSINEWINTPHIIIIFRDSYSVADAVIPYPETNHWQNQAGRASINDSCNCFTGNLLDSRLIYFLDGINFRMGVWKVCLGSVCGLSWEELSC